VLDLAAVFLNPFNETREQTRHATCTRLPTSAKSEFYLHLVYNASELCSVLIRWTVHNNARDLYSSPNIAVFVDKRGRHGFSSSLCPSKAVLEEINQNEGLSL
jgi:hypothetical protein